MLDVSIIIPAYCTTPESLQWLEECLMSARRQNCEVVVYDDGSPIDITPITEKCRVDILRKGGRNRGAAYARNKAVEASTKSLLLPLDCDDRLVSGAVKKLLDVWDGVPVYPDVRKFGDENVDHYVLLDFHCDHIRTHVGFTSVNVLHSRDQWKQVGGWNPTIDFFEDGEYNARLFSTFCGVHLKQPLVEYRQHPGQKTKRYTAQARARARRILQYIRSYPMACHTCGSRRSPAAAASKAAQSNPSFMATRRNPVAQDINSIPGEVNGRVLAQYVGGKGKGKHYYQGRKTKFRYQVVYGQLLHADPQDVRNPQDVGNPSLLVRVVRKEEPAAVAPAPKPAAKPAPAKPAPKRTPRVDRPKVPVVENDESEGFVPDVNRMSIPQIVKANPTYEQAVAMLKAERTGKKRKGAIEFLEKIVEK